MTEKETQLAIAAQCDELKEMLLEKNRKYGNSALEPIRVFSKADNLEQIRVRMDDKINRIRNQKQDDDEDALWDLAGYIILFQVAKREARKLKGIKEYEQKQS